MPNTIPPLTREEAPLVVAEAMAQLQKSQLCDDALFLEFKGQLEKSVSRGKELLQQMEPLMELLGYRRMGGPHDRAYRHEYELIEHELTMYEDRLLHFAEELKHLFSVSLHSLLKALVNQIPEIEQHIFLELCKYDTHVTVANPNGPEVHVELKQTKNLYLPPEVMDLIYSHCELEELVALRQVGSDWYAGFQRVSEQKFELIRTARNPWIKPGDEFSSWHDCALKFASRLRLWTEVDNLDDMVIPETLAEQRTTVAIEEEGPFPDNFTSMFSHKRSCISDSCDLMHPSIYNRYAVDVAMDPWTEKAVSIPPLYGCHELVREDDDTYDIKYLGSTYTLPHVIPPQEISGFIVGAENIIVEGNDTQVVVFPRANPDDWFEMEEIARSKELDDNLLLFEGMNGEYIAVDAEGDASWNYAKTEAFPVAYYNGLVWWLVNGKSLVPTFVDFETDKNVLLRRQSHHGLR
ncbi:hypothetical protein CJU89_5014 [Yarrowia sp. B02]|nr:hypothetical protein CJU89_5014 [Yarrowia sp. B02]